jgi:hypothetical protein
LYHSGFLQSHDNSDDEMEFPISRISPRSTKSLCSRLIIPIEVRERTVVLELFLEEFVLLAPNLAAERLVGEERGFQDLLDFWSVWKRGLKAAIYLFCGHAEVQEDREERKNT